MTIVLSGNENYGDIMKLIIITTALFFSGSVLAHWTSPVGASPTKEEVMPKEVREPSSVPVDKSSPKHPDVKKEKGT